MQVQPTVKYVQWPAGAPGDGSGKAQGPVRPDVMAAAAANLGLDGWPRPQADTTASVGNGSGAPDPQGAAAALQELTADGAVRMAGAPQQPQQQQLVMGRPYNPVSAVVRPNGEQAQQSQRVANADRTPGMQHPSGIGNSMLMAGLAPRTAMAAVPLGAGPARGLTELLDMFAGQAAPADAPAR